MVYGGFFNETLWDFQGPDQKAMRVVVKIEVPFWVS